MRPLFRLAVLALAAPLAGCFSVTAPKEVPPWAMATGTGERLGEPAKPVRRVARPRAVALESIANGPTVTGSVSAQPDSVRTPTPARSSNSPTAYTPEWFAQEHAADERLRRQMNICRAC
jgi:hypothetical protein